MNESNAVKSETVGLSVAEVRHEVLKMLTELQEGVRLDGKTHALIELSVRACGTTLDLNGTEIYLKRAIEAGVTLEQVQEMLVLISGIGIHSLLACSRLVAEVAAETDPHYLEPLTTHQLELRTELVGDGAREANTSRVAPGFVDNIIRFCEPDVARAIFAFRAAPWLGQSLSALQKEFIGIAVDTMESHRFLPTLRLHVANAIQLGAGRLAVTEVLDISGAAPGHRGVR
jgi:alkylhydroperoxidase/carboxymuconolactone decarboxylase family protein YurZ